MTDLRQLTNESIKEYFKIYNNDIIQFTVNNFDKIDFIEYLETYTNDLDGDYIYFNFNNEGYLIAEVNGNVLEFNCIITDYDTFTYAEQ